MEPVLDEFNDENEATDTDQEPQTDTDRTDGEEEMTTTPSQSRSSSIRPQPHLSFIDNDVDVFDGYSFKGRDSVLIDGSDGSDEEEEEGEEGSLGEEESIQEEDEDNRSILERLEEEAAQIGETKSVVGDGDGDDDDVSVKENGLLEGEPKTPEARPAATLPPVEEVVVPAVVEEVVPPVEEVVIPPVEDVVPPVDEVVMPPVAEEVVVLPAAEEVVPPVPEADDTVTEATNVDESKAELKVEEEAAVPTPEVLPTSRRSMEELGDTEPAKEVNGEIVSAKELNGAFVVDTKESNGRPTTPPPKARQPPPNRAGRSRREKSGVFALDRYLSDAIDEATEAERDDEDDDWDFVEAADGEDRNGTKGTSLFARGVVDRYRLAVFRKASIPTSRSGMRSVSGMSNASGTTAVSEVTESPSPSQRRGRTPGLTFRKNPRQFLRPKSPPSSFSATARSLSQSASSSNIFSAASTSSSGGGRLLSASHSVGSTFALSPSLKSKESAMSVGAQSQSSDQSANGTTSVVFVDAPDTIRGSPQLTTKGAEHKVKNKKLRRYKHNAEKVFSLFSSPRQAS